MIFLLDKKERGKIKRLLDTYRYNSDIADFLNEQIINEDLTDETNEGYEIKELKHSDYTGDKYYRQVKPNEVKIGNYQIKYEKYRPYQCFLSDDLTVDKNDYYLLKNHLGYFTKEYPYLTIQKDHVIWMSLIPHEMNTMNKYIKNVSGHVYVMGLGLGYFPFLISEQASKITIIENDPNIINLFKKHLLPFFSHQDKFEIILADAVNYISKIKLNDFIFIDLWHNVNDGLILYITLRKKLKNYKNVIYWINESFIAAFRNILINLIDEELNKHMDFSKARNKIDEIANHLHFLLKDQKISRYEEIKELLSNESIEQLMLKV